MKHVWRLASTWRSSVYSASLAMPTIVFHMVARGLEYIVVSREFFSAVETAADATLLIAIGVTAIVGEQHARPLPVSTMEMYRCFSPDSTGETSYNRIWDLGRMVEFRKNKKCDPRMHNKVPVSQTHR